MAMTDTDAEKRRKIIESINGTLASIDIAQKRVADASSQLGTAKTELAKHRKRYDEFHVQLAKLLPPTTDVELARTSGRPDVNLP